MAGPGIQLKFDVDDREVREYMARLLRKTLTLKPALESIGKSLVTSTRRRFETQRGPDGTPWKALRPATIRARERKMTRRGRAGRSVVAAMGGTFGAVPLIRTGHLLTSITYRATATELAVGTNRKMPGGKHSAAAIHQLGGRTGMAPGPAHIPARPFLGMDAADVRQTAHILMEHYGRA